MFYAFKGMVPVVDPSAFVHPQANVTGDVWIGKNVYIGPGAVLRGDWGRITIKEGSNVQENCIIHSFPDGAVMVGNPAKMVKQMSEKDIAWKTEGTQWYQRLPKECHDTLTPCQPLQEGDLNRPRSSGGFEPKS